MGRVDENAVTKGKVVSLVLPDAAVRIQSGAQDGFRAQFTGFTALRSVSGKMIDQLSIRAFMLLTALESASFPNLKTINGMTSTDNYEGGSGTTRYGAFRGCTALKTVSFPSVETIKINAFYACSALESLDLPNAETIGLGAFSYCTNLQSISLPKAKDLDYEVFYRCTMLTSITLGATPPVLKGALLSDAATPRTITVYVPAGASGAYDTEWQDKFKSNTTNITIEVVEE